MIKDIYENPQWTMWTNYYLSIRGMLNNKAWKLSVIRSGARQGCLFSSLLFSIALEVLLRAIKQ